MKKQKKTFAEPICEIVHFTPSDVIASSLQGWYSNEFDILDVNDAAN